MRKNFFLGKNSIKRCICVIAVIFALVLALSPAISAAESAKLKKYAPGEVLVVLKHKADGTGARSLSRAASESFAREVAHSVGAKAARTYAALSTVGDGVFALLKSDTKSAEELLADLKDNPDVISASPNYIKYALSAPNDPYYQDGTLWGMDRINAPAAWDVTVGDENVHVAVMDTGIMSGHEDLAGNFSAYSRNFTEDQNGHVNPNAFGDEDGHGTHVSGTIGGVGDNEKGVVGVNWRAKIITLRVLGEDGTGKTSWQVDAMNYLIELLEKNPGLRVPAVNLSLGGPESLTPEEQVGTPEWLAFKALDRLNKMVIVVAAGNNAFEVGAPAQYSVTNADGDVVFDSGDYEYPASLVGIDNLIVVGSIDSGDGASEFSNWSSKFVHMVAPGGKIMSTYNDGSYFSESGTSMATPHVTGAAALLASHYPTWNAAQLKSHLLLTSNLNVNPETEGVTIDPPIEGLPITRQIAGDYKLSKFGLLDVGKAMTATPRESVPAVGVALIPDKTATLEVGQTGIFGAIVSPEEATDKRLTWTSLTPAVATVDEKGTVTGRAAGSSIIVASASSGIQASVPVHVVSKSGPTPAPVQSSGDGGGCNSGAFGILAGILLLATCTKRRI
jgi:subtilisin family serine protease